MEMLRHAAYTKHFNMVSNEKKLQIGIEVCIEKILLASYMVHVSTNKNNYLNDREFIYIKLLNTQNYFLLLPLEKYDSRLIFFFYPRKNIYHYFLLLSIFWDK